MTKTANYSIPQRRSDSDAKERETYNAAMAQIDAAIAALSATVAALSATVAALSATVTALVTGVSSVFGRTGAVVLATDDITLLGEAASTAYAGMGMRNGTLVASVSGNALTIAVKTLAGNNPSASDPVDFFFRNATIATGDYVRRRVTSALSVVVPSGQALGTVNSVPFRVWVTAIDNAGTVELAVMNCRVGGASPTVITPLEEDSLVSTTAIATAPSAGIMYSTTARALKAFRILGWVAYASGLAAAGTWSSGPTKTHLFGPGSQKPGETIQVAYATNSGSLTTASGSYQSTALTLSLSLSDAANVAVIQAQGSLYSPTINTGGNAALFRGSTALTANEQFIGGTGPLGAVFPISLFAFDAPGVTTAISYLVKILSRTATNVTWNVDALVSPIMATEIMG